MSGSADMTTAFLILTAIFAVMVLMIIWSRNGSIARHVAIAALPVAVFSSWYILTVPLGRPASSPPPGEYSILGARIDIDVAIFVLVDAPEPRYYKLPYSEDAAEQLQQALDEGSGVQMDMQESGELVFGTPPVPADPPKQQERPDFRIGD